MGCVSLVCGSLRCASIGCALMGCLSMSNALWGCGLMSCPSKGHVSICNPSVGYTSVGCAPLGGTSLCSTSVGCSLNGSAPLCSTSMCYASVRCPSMDNASMGRASLGCALMGCTPLGCASKGSASLGCDSLDCATMDDPSKRSVLLPAIWGELAPSMTIFNWRSKGRELVRKHLLLVHPGCRFLSRFMVLTYTFQCPASFSLGPFHGVYWLLPTLSGKLSPVIPPLFTHLVEQKVASTPHLKVLPSFHSLGKPLVLPHELPCPTPLMVQGMPPPTEVNELLTAASVDSRRPQPFRCVLTLAPDALEASVPLTCRAPARNSSTGPKTLISVAEMPPHGRCRAPTAALVDSQRLQAFRCVLPNTHDDPYPSEPLQHRGDAEIADSRPRIRLPALTLGCCQPS